MCCMGLELLGWRRVRRVRRVGQGLYFLYFTYRLVQNRLYAIEARGRFTDCWSMPAIPHCRAKIVNKYKTMEYSGETSSRDRMSFLTTRPPFRSRFQAAIRPVCKLFHCSDYITGENLRTTPRSFRLYLHGRCESRMRTPKNRWTSNPFNNNRRMRLE